MQALTSSEEMAFEDAYFYSADNRCNMIHVDTGMDVVLYHILEDNSECARQFTEDMDNVQDSIRHTNMVQKYKDSVEDIFCQTSRGCSRMVTEHETRANMLSYQVDDSLCAGSDCMLIG